MSNKLDAMNTNNFHTPVLVTEIVQALDVRQGKNILTRQSVAVDTQLKLLKTRELYWELIMIHRL